MSKFINNFSVLNSNTTNGLVWSTRTEALWGPQEPGRVSESSSSLPGHFPLHFPKVTSRKAGGHVPPHHASHGAWHMAQPRHVLLSRTRQRAGHWGPQGAKAQQAPHWAAVRDTQATAPPQNRGAAWDATLLVLLPRHAPLTADLGKERTAGLPLSRDSTEARALGRGHPARLSNIPKSPRTHSLTPQLQR